MNPQNLNGKNTDLSDEIAKARQLIDASSQIAVLTGAGISTDSGIPDFRGPKGVWTLNPETEKASNIENYVNEPEVHQRNWQRLLDNAGSQSYEPNAGHFAIVSLYERQKLHTLITQNIDGLHSASGIEEGKIVEVHGTRNRVKCLECDDEHPMETAIKRVKAGEMDPECLLCGGILKSATISFGQALVPEDIMRSEIAAQECDLMLAVGSTLEVYPIASVVPLAKSLGAKLIIVNGDPTILDELADVVIHGSISEVLPEITNS